ncbi:alpha/beta hydrolase [Kurthia sibirica]|uniref:Carboxylesterase n=1 Tax=Kurthia sibirica TaxID=202750 RepID=A0A2U3AKH4_9BACL|nr:alpha/beta hydrolase [Kurthia sibirica]PWI25037.1 carboxylesterase [Kurthia sibirica]GEK34201.1 carboxylesterase [Kurthia sibirica]
MESVFIKGLDEHVPTLLLLHGTGGNEKDLLGLGRQLDAQANLLGVRGSETENGMPRFFKRLGMGVFDLDNLSMRTKELAAFIDEAAREYDFDRDNIIVVGYSNGANIAANLFFEIGKIVKGAILHHPMIPRTDVDMPDLNGLQVWIGAGQNDQMCPIEQSTGLKDYLEQAGAEVDMYWHDHGHQLTADEVNAAKKWYDTTMK